MSSYNNHCNRYSVLQDNNSKEKGDENQDSQSISVSGDLKHKEATKTSFVELLKLNRPDWYLVLIGVLCSAVIGCIFPVIAIPFSEVLKVSACEQLHALVSPPGSMALSSFFLSRERQAYSHMSTSSGYSSNPIKV